MRRYILLVAAMFVLGGGISAQAQDLKSILGGIAKEVVGNKVTTQTSIIGTWVYAAPAIKMKGEDDVSNIVSSVASATSAFDGKLEPIYAKVGLDKSVFSFNEDGTYKTEMGKIKTSGTYTFNPEDKTITMKTKLGVSVTATVVTTGPSMTLLFNADKVMGAVKTITGFAGSISKSAATINSLAKKYNGVSVGFELKKQ